METGPGRVHGYAIVATNPANLRRGLVGFRGRPIWFETRAQVAHSAGWVINRFKLCRPEIVEYEADPERDLYFGHFAQGVDHNGCPLESYRAPAGRD